MNERTDITFMETENEVIIYADSPVGAQWIARFLTTNIAESGIHYEKQRGFDVLKRMKDDELVVKRGTDET